MTVFRFEIQLLELLDTIADSLSEIGVEPLFLGECPNKFNDADQDDLWYAVQAGTAYWEQSHFFEYRSEPLVREHTSYPTKRDVEEIKQAGATVNSDQISYLREKLRLLQIAEWRELCDWDGLAALIVERDQRWLVLERPNDSDGEVYAWDEYEMFRVGTVERIDQRVGKDRLLVFKTVDQEHVERLNDGAKVYFEPQTKNTANEEKLAEMLWDVTLQVRKMSDQPFAMCSRGSRQNVSDDTGFQPPRSYSRDLRRNEGELRKPKDGKWPKYRENFQQDPTEYSDIAKTLHTCLAELEDADWRALFGKAFGEVVEKGQHLSLFANSEFSVLMRDNVAFEVKPNKLERLGIFDHPNLWNHEDVLTRLEKRLRG